MLGTPVASTRHTSMAAMSRFPLVFATTDTKQLKCALACIMSMCCLGLIASQVSVWGKRSPRQPREGIDMQLKVAESVPGEFQAMLLAGWLH